MIKANPPPNPLVLEPSGWQLPTLQEIFILPGDWALYLISTDAPSVALQLGLESVDYGSSHAALLALCFWVLLSLCLVMASTAVRAVNRLLAGTVGAGYAKLTYRIRLMRALAAYRQRVPERTEPTFEDAPP